MTDHLHALPSGYRIEEYELVRVLGSLTTGISSRFIVSSGLMVPGIA